MIDLQELIRNQQGAGFADLAGTSVAVFLPVSQRLLNEIVPHLLPPDAPVSHVSLEVLPENRIAVRARLARAPIIPAIRLTMTIVQQPSMPQNPVLGLQIGSGGFGGLMSLAGPALRLFDALPPGIKVQGERLLVDIRELLARRGQDWILPHLVELQVTTTPGAVLVTASLQIKATITD